MFLKKLRRNAVRNLTVTATDQQRTIDAMLETLAIQSQRITLLNERVDRLEEVEEVSPRCERHPDCVFLPEHVGVCERLVLGEFTPIEES